jgi:CRP-like cAMP-binding protein
MMDKFPIDRTVTSLLGLFFKMAFLAHLLACGNMLIASRSPNWEHNSWMAAYVPSPCFNRYGGYMEPSDPDADKCNGEEGVSLAHASAGTQYLVALYWALTTLTTVGYGDVVPLTNMERGWGIASMAIGAACFAFILGNIADLIAHANAAEALTAAKMENLNVYMETQEVPFDLCVKIRRYLRYAWKRKSVFDENVILEDLQPKLKAKLLAHVHSQTLQSIKLFSLDSGMGFATLIVTAMKPLCIPASEQIISQGSYGSDMYFIMSGKCKVYIQNTGAGEVEVTAKDLSDKDEKARVIREMNDSIWVATLNEGDHFGEIALLPNVVTEMVGKHDEHEAGMNDSLQQMQEQWKSNSFAQSAKSKLRTASVTCTDTADLQVVNAEQIHIALVSFPPTFRALFDMATQRLRQLQDGKRHNLPFLLRAFLCTPFWLPPFLLFLLHNHLLTMSVAPFASFTS